jgi:16S rRNA (guanine966-N2)-methyltransferase
VARKRKAAGKSSKRSPVDPGREPATVRIIGGSMRGRKLLYSGEPERTRPMKDRVREAVFNLLGPAVAGKHAIDLFAGSGALALEAISRGAGRATLIERHFPTAAGIRQNAVQLGVADQVEVLAADTFIWAQKQAMPVAEPWLVFCSPPYAFYLERAEAMLSLVGVLIERAPPGSIFVVESDRQFEMGLLPGADAWDIREYPPAVIAIFRKEP